MSHPAAAVPFAIVGLVAWLMSALFALPGVENHSWVASAVCAWIALSLFLVALLLALFDFHFWLRPHPRKT